MPNTQVSQGGVAVAIQPYSVAPGNQSPRLKILDPSGNSIYDDYGSASLDGYQNGISVAHQAAEIAVGGDNFYVYNLSAAASVPLGTGYKLTTRGDSSNFVATAFFDVVIPSDTTAPVPLSATVNGNQLTIIWTETGSSPVLQVPLGLPDTVSAAGAGVSVDNATYTRSTTVDFLGNLYYRNSTTGRGIDFGSIIGGTSGWRLYNGLNADGSIAGSRDYESPTCTFPNFPLSGWSNAAGGAAPPPTFTRSSGGQYTPNQGLSISGLSGGAVTISNVVTSGTTTTATLSRVIAAGETGGTLSGAAGAFSDSASTPNYTAAFSLSITVATPATAPRNLTTVVVY